MKTLTSADLIEVMLIITFSHIWQL